MGEYAGIKRKKVEQMLRWLDTCSGFIKKPLLVGLVKQILATGVCTKDELDAHLK